ncbi:hypothetical protein KCH_10200 [Kitasatospora cheerisanensis KCTC 2395]|uniref:TerD domain-containing protein n=1 Tax=Kitasatospora cheerisanensis KCTC 2395 TaxID=1348663 RepID=A0A066Z4U6_9ACTN|nr:hypothetical protein KCH_10200 [Kitasatospora cheerisanensis KCTC 2395]
MSTALAKGANVPVLRDGKGPATVLIGLGWQAADDYDLDANALLCDSAGKALSDQHFVFFNNLTSPDGAVTHLGDPGDGTDREQLRVELGAVEQGVQRIVFTVAVYQAEQRRQAFGSVRGAYVRVADAASGAELARYELGPELTTETAVVFGELYRHGGGWKFRAIGQGYSSGLAGIATDFGVAVLAPAPRPLRLLPPRCSCGPGSRRPAGARRRARARAGPRARRGPRAARRRPARDRRRFPDDLLLRPRPRPRHHGRPLVPAVGRPAPDPLLRSLRPARPDHPAAVLHRARRPGLRPAGLPRPAAGLPRSPPGRRLPGRAAPGPPVRHRRPHRRRRGRPGRRRPPQRGPQRRQPGRDRQQLLRGLTAPRRAPAPARSGGAAHHPGSSGRWCPHGTWLPSFANTWASLAEFTHTEMPWA